MNQAAVGGKLGTSPPDLQNSLSFSRSALLPQPKKLWVIGRQMPPVSDRNRVPDVDSCPWEADIGKSQRSGRENAAST